MANNVDSGKDRVEASAGNPTCQIALFQNDCIIHTPSNGLEFAGLHVWSQHMLNPNGCGYQDIGLNTCLNSLVEVCRKMFEIRQRNIVGRRNGRFGVDSFFGVAMLLVYISILDTSQLLRMLERPSWDSLPSRLSFNSWASIPSCSSSGSSNLCIVCNQIL